MARLGLLMLRDGCAGLALMAQCLLVETDEFNGFNATFATFKAEIALESIFRSVNLGAFLHSCCLKPSHVFTFLRMACCLSCVSSRVYIFFRFTSFLSSLDFCLRLEMPLLSLENITLSSARHVTISPHDPGKVIMIHAIRKEQRRKLHCRCMQNLYYIYIYLYTHSISFIVFVDVFWCISEVFIHFHICLTISIINVHTCPGINKYIYSMYILYLSKDNVFTDFAVRNFEARREASKTRTERMQVKEPTL